MIFTGWNVFINLVLIILILLISVQLLMRNDSVIS